MKTATQLKALIKNLAKEKGIKAQVVLRNFMMERLLERISLSGYKDKFILKGGVLVSAIVGLDARATMDIDATLQGMPLTEDAIREMFDNIQAVEINDNVEIALRKIDTIRDEAAYSGYRLKLDCTFDTISETLKVDVTTGERITPREMEYELSLMLEPRSIGIMAYNLETVLAEKLETILSRGTANTRMRDFYDIYILTRLKNDQIDKSILKNAVAGTTDRRGTGHLLKDAQQRLDEMETSTDLIELWKGYQENYDYAQDVKWVDTIAAARTLL